MVHQHFDQVREIRLETDADLETRVGEILDAASRRQLWLMFLDLNSRQLPVLIPADIPPRPGKREVLGFSTFLTGVMEATEAATLVFVLERPGSDHISVRDAEWFRFLQLECSSASIPTRGPILCHDGGVRWVAADDFVT